MPAGQFAAAANRKLPSPPGVARAMAAMAAAAARAARSWIP